MSYHPKYCTLLYCLSCLLDAVDGQAARLLGQTSKFSAVLDMVTDRYAFSLTSVYFHHLTGGEMHDFVFVMLPIIGLSYICSLLPVPDRSRLQQPLHAYVQVRHPLLHFFPFGTHLNSAPFQLSCYWLSQPQVGH